MKITLIWTWTPVSFLLILTSLVVCCRVGIYRVYSKHHQVEVKIEIVYNAKTKVIRVYTDGALATVAHGVVTYQRCDRFPVNFKADFSGSTVEMSLSEYRDGRFLLCVKDVPFDEMKDVEMADAEDSVDEGDMQVDGSLQGFIKLNDKVVLRGDRPIADFSQDAFF